MEDVIPGSRVKGTKAITPFKVVFGGQLLVGYNMGLFVTRHKQYAIWRYTMEPCRFYGVRDTANGSRGHDGGLIDLLIALDSSACH